jgi:hypothetical protein
MTENDNTTPDDLASLRKTLSTYPVCYSPFRYWIAFIVGASFTGVNASFLVNYYHNCPRDATFSPANIWYCLMTAFLGNFAVFHLMFIIGRFLKQTPVTGVYDSGVERAFKFPMAINLLVLIGMSVWGIVLAKNGTACESDESVNKAIRTKAIVFLVFSLSGIVRHVRDRLDIGRE